MFYHFLYQILYNEYYNVRLSHAVWAHQESGSGSGMEGHTSDPSIFYAKCPPQTPVLDQVSSHSVVGEREQQDIKNIVSLNTEDKSIPSISPEQKNQLLFLS